MHVFVYFCVSLRACVCLCVFVCECVHVCVSKCMCVSVGMIVCVCVSVCVLCVHACTFAFLQDLHRVSDLQREAMLDGPSEARQHWRQRTRPGQRPGVNQHHRDEEGEGNRCFGRRDRKHQKER